MKRRGPVTAWVLVLASAFPVAAQQGGRSGAQSATKRAGPVGAPRIGCTQCPGTLLVIVDEECNLRVDGQDVGHVAADASKLVKVDLGQHLITARATDLKDGDIKWENTITVSQAGQILVKTSLSVVRARNAQAARDEAAAAAAASARRKMYEDWNGEWSGELKWRYAGDPGSYYIVTANIYIDVRDGVCSVKARYEREYHGSEGFVKVVDGEEFSTLTCQVVGQNWNIIDLTHPNLLWAQFSYANRQAAGWLHNVASGWDTRYITLAK
jgi:hypothetical protein